MDFVLYAVPVGLIIWGISAVILKRATVKEYMYGTSFVEYTGITAVYTGFLAIIGGLLLIAFLYSSGDVVRQVSTPTPTFDEISRSVRMPL